MLQCATVCDVTFRISFPSIKTQPREIPLPGVTITSSPSSQSVKKKDPNSPRSPSATSSDPSCQPRQKCRWIIYPYVSTVADSPSAVGILVRTRADGKIQPNHPPYGVWCHGRCVHSIICCFGGKRTLLFPNPTRCSCLLTRTGDGRDQAAIMLD